MPAARIPMPSFTPDPPTARALGSAVQRWASEGRRAAWAGVYVSLCVGVSASLSACGPSGPSSSAPAPGAGAPAMPVAVRTVQQTSVPVLVDAVGQAEGSKEVEVRARVGGLIERRLYQEGDRVRAGAPLFAIERAPFEIALAQARAALAQEQARADQTQRETRRLAPLAQMQAISQREADDAASNAQLAQAALAAAQARVREAELNLSYTAVTAPIAGVTGRAEKSEGSLVSTTDGLLTRITQTDPVWVRFSFNEAELALLRRNRAAPVRLLEAGAAQPLATGRLNFSGSSVDARLGTVQLRAEFPNPELRVLPGQFVRAQVEVGREQAWLVPQAAVMTNESGRMVWVIRDGKATPTPVQVGGWVGADWVVRSGLKDGDAVIVNNLIKMRPGAAVQLAAAPAASGQTAAAAPAASGQTAAAAPAASAASR